MVAWPCAGVFLNKLCPNWVIVALLVALCAFSGKRTIAQAVKRREKEDREQGAYKSLQQTESESHEVHGGSELKEVGDADGSPDIGKSGKSSKFKPSAEAQTNLASEIAQETGFQWGSLAALSRTWLTCMGLSMLKGGQCAPCRAHSCPPPPTAHA